jgi:hypothetical protein
MESDSVSLLRADIAALRGDLTGIRQNLGVLDARTDALENWRERYLKQEDKVISALAEIRADLARIRGERDAERRMSITVVSLLSAICGGLATNLLHFPGR